MFKGANGKRINYLFSSVLRSFCFLAFLIAFIVVKIVVKPSIDWLNTLLICLSIGGLISGIFNLILCGFTATSYKQNKAVQIICFVVTLLTGGIISSTLTGIATFLKVSEEEITNENVFKTRLK